MPSFLVCVTDSISRSRRSIQSTDISADSLDEARRKADCLALTAPDWLGVDSVELVDILGRLIDKRGLYAEWGLAARCAA